MQLTETIDGKGAFRATPRSLARGRPGSAPAALRRPERACHSLPAASRPGTSGMSRIIGYHLGRAPAIFRLGFLALIATVVIISPSMTWANVPPPPVNQYLGVPDVRYRDMTSATCLECHGNPGKAAAPVKSGYLPDRHHLRIDTPIGRFSASPFPERSPDGNHKCVTCHQLVWREDESRPAGGSVQLVLDEGFRDCLNGCHTQKKNQLGRLIASVHHLTENAQLANCHNCHGSLIDDPNGDHRIPDPIGNPGDRENHYDISLTTPWPGIGFYNSRVQLRGALRAYYRPRLVLPPSPSEEQLLAKQETEALIDYIMDNFNPPIGETGRPMGNCSYCHFAGTDDMTGLRIGVNYANHHGTGVGQPGTGSVHGCTLCHQPSAPPDYTIRGCERCHGIESLHNIEYDANGDGVVIGEEDPFYGHIGNPKNCDGCHRNYQGEISGASAGGTTGGDFLIPEITEISVSSAVAGRATRLTISGTGFMDREHAGTQSSWLRLEGIDRNTFDIPPDLLSPSQMEVTLERNIPPGSYRMRVVKQREPDRKTVTSTALNFLIVPEPTIDSAVCAGDRVTITGSGFGSYLEAVDSGTMVSASSSSCDITSWSDDRIVAECSSLGEGSVRVDGIFGSATTPLSCDSGRPRWWTIWSWWSSWSWSRR